jgi:hypothetical protein
MTMRGVLSEYHNVNTHNQENFKSYFMFVDHASRYMRVMKTNLMHYLSSVYFVSQPLHVSGIFVAHYQEVYYIYTTISTGCTEKIVV